MMTFLDSLSVGFYFILKLAGWITGAALGITLVMLIYVLIAVVCVYFLRRHTDLFEK